jgi:methylthioxylose transferase
VTLRDTRPTPASPATARRVSRADLVTAGGALGLVALAGVVGAALYLAGRPVHASAAPFTAVWLPHAGPGTPLAVAVAAVVVWHGPRLATTLGWRSLLAAGYAGAVAWILSLALVDGWQRGLAGRLSTTDEYLHDVPGVTDVPAMLRGFAGRIVDFQPDSWTTHVAGHPPGAFLVFLCLDRIGLGGGAWAAITCVAVGGLGAVAVPVTIRALGDEAAARAAVPFLVLFPGAIWIGASADGLFAGVTASGLALLAIGITRRHLLAGLAAGSLLAIGVYLSYGLTLIVVPAIAVTLLARRPRPWPWACIAAAAGGAAAVTAAFTLAGFWWLDGYHAVVVRYHQGIASQRPYAYWAWADLALVVACAGPAAAVILRRAVAPALSRRPFLCPLPRPAAVLPCAALLAIVIADVSGLSKAEVERIWLPFAVWLLAGAALLPPPTRRGWLLAQAAIALLINHLLLTTW